MSERILHGRKSHLSSLPAILRNLQMMKLIQPRPIHSNAFHAISRVTHAQRIATLSDAKRSGKSDVDVYSHCFEEILDAKDDFKTKYKNVAKDNVMRLISAENKKIQEQKKTTTLEDERSVALTTNDTWSSPNSLIQLQPYTCDYLNEANGVIETLMLLAKPIIGRHSAKNLAKSIRSTIADFSFQDKIVAVVTVGATNVRKAVKDEQHGGICCAAHRLNVLAVLKNIHQSHHSRKEYIERLSSRKASILEIIPSFKMLELSTKRFLEVRRNKTTISKQTNRRKLLVMGCLTLCTKGLCRKKFRLSGCYQKRETTFCKPGTNTKTCLRAASPRKSFC
ncbi:unnamed protein product, partial [Mesorhabditis belari]|uniref:Uncharacterized protein n=1 Tax=Mesorhabditis belari TaxID=2138241 RepID=A0AAF3EZI5_9BILA